MRLKKFWTRGNVTILSLVIVQFLMAYLQIYRKELEQLTTQFKEKLRSIKRDKNGWIMIEGLLWISIMGLIFYYYILTYKHYERLWEKEKEKILTSRNYPSSDSI